MLFCSYYDTHSYNIEFYEIPTTSPTQYRITPTNSNKRSENNNTLKSVNSIVSFFDSQKLRCQTSIPEDWFNESFKSKCRSFYCKIAFTFLQVLVWAQQVDNFTQIQSLMCCITSKLVIEMKKLLKWPDVAGNDLKWPPVRKFIRCRNFDTR